jgi:hypothetical protein
MESSTSVAVLQCLLTIGGKKESKESKTIYTALVTPESSSGAVTYRHGVAVVSFFSRDMWVPLWVTGVAHDCAETCRWILTRIYILHTK